MADVQREPCECQYMLLLVGACREYKGESVHVMMPYV